MEEVAWFSRQMFRKAIFWPGSESEHLSGKSRNLLHTFYPNWPWSKELWLGSTYQARRKHFESGRARYKKVVKMEKKYLEKKSRKKFKKSQKNFQIFFLDFFRCLVWISSYWLKFFSSLSTTWFFFLVFLCPCFQLKCLMNVEIVFRCIMFSVSTAQNNL